MMGLMTAPADPPDPAEVEDPSTHDRLPEHADLAEPVRSGELADPADPAGQAGPTDPGDLTGSSGLREPAQTIMSAEPVPLTGTQYYIQAGDYQACVTELGAGLRRLTYRDQPLITGYEPDELPPAGAGQLLAPWPNRIAGGRYEFNGETHQLELSEAARGNAIHGLTRWANWELAAHAPAAITPDQVTLTHVLHGRPGYPFCLELSVSYLLDPLSGLHVAVTAWNAGSGPPRTARAVIRTSPPACRSWTTASLRSRPRAGCLLMTRGSRQDRLRTSKARPTTSEPPARSAIPGLITR